MSVENCCVARGLWALVASAFVVMSTACVDVRDRPSDPTAPGASTDRPSFVRITHPTEGQTFFRTTLTDEPGVQITFTCRFEEGDELLLLVFTDLAPNTPVFAAAATVEAESPPTSAWIRLSPGEVQGVSEVEILLRLLEPDDGPVISTDSVGVVLQ